MITYWKCLSVILCVILVGGCGYQLVGKETHLPSGISSVAIPTFTNRTLEPGIEIPFTQAFLRGFILDRRVNVVDRTTADAFLEGVIKSCDFHAVSFDRSGLVLEYQTTVVVDLALKRRDGQIVWTQKDLSDTRWFRASSNVLVNEANKDVALQQIGELMAERIRDRFYYNF